MLFDKQTLWKMLRMTLISGLLFVGVAIVDSFPENTTSLIAVSSDDHFSNECDKNLITWDYAIECTKHGFDGTLFITENYGQDNLTPHYDLNKGPSDWLFPELLPAALSIYKITHQKNYLDCARCTADSIEMHMLNDKNIVRMYSNKKGASDTRPTSLNFYVLPVVAELALYDSNYRSLALRIANGIVNYGISEKNIPYGAIYPDGKPAITANGLSSNGGAKGTLSLAVIGLLRAYEATENPKFLNKSRDILISVWHFKNTKHNLIPTTFDSVTLRTVNSNTQMYATGELLRAYIYYYYLTHDKEIKDIIETYSKAAYNIYWDETANGKGYFVYKVNANKGRSFQPLLETNWHKFDMSLLYAGEISGQDYDERLIEDMNTYWLDEGLIYKNHLFRHGTNPDGSPSHNGQSLIYSSMRTAIYLILRMMNAEILDAPNCTWNDKVWDHINSTRTYHYHKYGYHSDVDVETLNPDPNYNGLSIVPACGEFASLVTLIFNSTQNVRMVWESFPQGDTILEPFPTAYSADDVGFMRGIFMDRMHKEIAFRNITSEGEGEINCGQPIYQVIKDGQLYTNWSNTHIATSDGSHEYVIIFKGGSFIKPVFP